MSSGATVALQRSAPLRLHEDFSPPAIDAEPLLRALGPEPLGNEFDAAMLAARCTGKKTSIKAALLDQRVVAGLGNIYVFEALYRARISPQASVDAGDALERAATSARSNWSMRSRRCSHEAIEAGGSSLRDYPRRPTASSAISSTGSASTSARAKRARRAAATARSGAS